MSYGLRGQEEPGLTKLFRRALFHGRDADHHGFWRHHPDDAAGRLLSVGIMVVGVGLFLQLVRAIFSPAKVKHKCPECGLTKHDVDAIHCKHCGHDLKIETEGAT